MARAYQAFKMTFNHFLSGEAHEERKIAQRRAHIATLQGTVDTQHLVIEDLVAQLKDANIKIGLAEEGIKRADEWTELERELRGIAEDGLHKTVEENERLLGEVSAAKAEVEERDVEIGHLQQEITDLKGDMALFDQLATRRGTKKACLDRGKGKAPNKLIRQLFLLLIVLFPLPLFFSLLWSVELSSRFLEVSGTLQLRTTAVCDEIVPTW
ncbi:hypothetical protein A4X09_0g7583 [Tilletia walkeri]|uniref:Uncharacterized protein n=1 Tax=Tilletia walkeri TaxID=117179 RepID=A0A8X7N1N0_9BASI|nr:hypothetical protein A4X09_0g7583 [Tilletia walkeri]